MSNIFYIGILFLILGMLYLIFNFTYEDEHEDDNVFSTTDKIYSWGISIILIIVGAIMIFNNYE